MLYKELDFFQSRLVGFFSFNVIVTLSKFVSLLCYNKKLTNKSKLQSQFSELNHCCPKYLNVLLSA